MTPADDEFDTRMRALLRSLPINENAPLPLPRRRFLRAGAAVVGAAFLACGAGGLGLAYADTPPLVRAALAHVHEESELRGDLSPLAPVRQALGLGPNAPFPGVLQLCKRCVVDGRLAWHVSVFLDGLGYVQIIVFRQPVDIAAGRGWWLGKRWLVYAAPHRNTLILLSPSAAALQKVAQRLHA